MRSRSARLELMRSRSARLQLLRSRSARLQLLSSRRTRGGGRRLRPLPSWLFAQPQLATDECAKEAKGKKTEEFLPRRNQVVEMGEETKVVAYLLVEVARKYSQLNLHLLQQARQIARATQHVLPLLANVGQLKDQLPLGATLTNRLVAPPLHHQMLHLHRLLLQLSTPTRRQQLSTTEQGELSLQA